jgi:hypothetical protein
VQAIASPSGWGEAASQRLLPIDPALKITQHLGCDVGSYWGLSLVLGGDVRLRLGTPPGLVPFINVPFPTVKPRTGWIGGVALPPDTLRHTPSPVTRSPVGVAGAWKGYNRRCGLPLAPKVGLCGCMAVRQSYYIANGGTRHLVKRSRRPFWQGLLLGLLSGGLGRFGDLSLLLTGLWGIQKGKADGVRSKPSLRRASSVTLRASAPVPVTRDLFCPET